MILKSQVSNLHSRTIFIYVIINCLHIFPWTLGAKFEQELLYMEMLYKLFLNGIEILKAIVYVEVLDVESNSTII